MRKDFDRHLETAISAFVSDIQELARRAALEAVAGAFGSDGAPASAAVRAREPGAKRSPRELAAEVARLERYVKEHPGERIEQIGRALGVATRELALPAKKLLTDGRLRTEGQKRATRYYVS